MKRVLLALTVMMLIGVTAGFFLFSYYKEKYITGENANENFQKGIGKAWDAISEGEFKEKIASNEINISTYLKAYVVAQKK